MKKTKIQVDKLKFIKMIPQIEVAVAADEVNKKLSSNPAKLWFEILTNFSSDAKNIIFDIKRDVEQNGFFVKVIQDGNGTTLETIDKNRLKSSNVDKVFLTEKSKDTSSIYGTGLSLIGFYSKNLIIKVKTLEDTDWSVWNTITNDVYYESLDLESGVIYEMFIPFQRTFPTYFKYIQSLRDILSTYDARNISNGRTYKIKVTGMDTPTDNKILSEVIQPNLIEWVDIAGKSQNGPDVDSLELGGKRYDSIQLDAIGVNEEDMKITLTNFRLGKRNDNKNYPKYISDIPMLNVYYKGSQQLAFTLPLRGSSGLVSLNNVVFEADIEKNELRYFFESTDKFVGIISSLKDVLIKELRTYLLSQYPDTDVLEKAIQEWFYDLLVYDIIGEFPSNSVRDKYQLSFLNDLSIEEREKVVHKEWDDAEGRLDFKIFLINETDGVITQDTPILIIETKRKDFSVTDRRQAITYMASTSKCTRIMAISLGISTSAIDNWNKLATKVCGSGQLRFQPKFDMIDVAKIGFNSFLKEYQDKVLLKQKN
jgi:hypothetical protein